MLNGKISHRQLQMLLILDVFGTGIITLPRRVADYANQDGWLVMVMAALFLVISVFLISSLAALFPNKSFIEYTAKVISRPIAYLIGLGLVFKFLLFISLELRVFGEIVRELILPQTPYVSVCILMLLVGTYIASRGYEARGRLAEILFFIVFAPLIFILLLGSREVDFTNIMPFFTNKPINFLSGGFLTALSFTGFEFLFLAVPHLNKPKNARKDLFFAVLFVSALALFITILTIAKFGPADLRQQIWPVLELMDLIHISGSVMERQTVIIVSFWIVSVFFSVNACLFFSSLILRDIIKAGTHSFFSVLCALIVFAVSVFALPKGIEQVYKLLELSSVYLGVLYLFIIPLLLLTLAKLRRLGDLK